MPKTQNQETPSKKFEERGTQMSRDFLGAVEESELDQYLSKYCSKYSIPKKVLKKTRGKKIEIDLPSAKKEKGNNNKNKIKPERVDLSSQKPQPIFLDAKNREMKLTPAPKRIFQKPATQTAQNTKIPKITSPPVENLKFGTLFRETQTNPKIKPELNLLDEKTLSICDKYSRREDSEERSLSLPKITRGLSQDKSRSPLKWKPKRKKLYSNNAFNNTRLNQRARQEYTGKSPSVSSQKNNTSSRDWSLEAPKTRNRFARSFNQTAHLNSMRLSGTADPNMYSSKTHTKGFYNPNATNNTYYVMKSDRINYKNSRTPRGIGYQRDREYPHSQRHINSNNQNRFQSTHNYDEFEESTQSRGESSDSSSHQYGKFKSNFRKFRRQFKNLNTNPPQPKPHKKKPKSKTPRRPSRLDLNTSKKTREKTLEKKNFESKRKQKNLAKRKSNHDHNTPSKRETETTPHTESPSEPEITEISFHRAVEDLIENSNGRLTFKRRSGGSITQALKDFLKEQSKIKKKSRDKEKRKSNLASIGSLGDSEYSSQLEENQKERANRGNYYRKRGSRDRNFKAKFKAQPGSRVSQSGGHPWSRGNSKGRVFGPDISDYDSVVENVLRASRVYRQKKELHKKLAEVEKRKRNLKKMLNDI